MKCPINPEHGELSVLVRHTDCIWIGIETNRYDKDTQAYCKTCKEEKSDKIQDLLIDLMYELSKKGDYEDREVTV